MVGYLTILYEKTFLTNFNVFKIYKFIERYIYILIVFLYESKMISLEMGPGIS
jgi:hypothetical protein